VSRTKIVCTLGPASSSVEILKQLIDSGMNVARLNFSHGNHEGYTEYIANIKEASQGKHIGILLDTQGPEIRTGMLKDKVTLQAGSSFILRTTDGEGDETGVSVTYSRLAEEVYPGAKILIDDGLIELKVEKATQTEIHCTVMNGGELGSRKGINLPGIAVNLPAVTDKDVADITFGIDQGVDFIAASFVRKASDVLEIRKILESKGADIHIISKIENHEGVKNIDEILLVSDGIMVARGDLGVEIPTEEVPLVQKSIIEKCNRFGKPVITATQMLDSMIRNPRPTRAEASDVANAIFDGTDAVMLSGETASGKYPVEAVKTMAKIAERTEQALGSEDILRKRMAYFQTTIPDAISHAVATTSTDLGASSIITATKSGSTARMVSKYRPKAPIIAATPSILASRKLSVVWGVTPLIIDETAGTDDLVAEAVAKALAAKYVNSGDLIVITAGVPVGVPGSTNLIKVHIVGQILVRGTGVGTKTASGTIRIVATAKAAIERMQPGDILVSRGTERDWVPAMEKAGGVIVEEGGLTSHAAIVCLTLGIPVIVGAESATKMKDGEIVTMDCRRGLVYHGIARVL
jgi:pyruvate kinase